jgi:ABC-2 type transport system ATP-binding protein
VDNTIIRVDSLRKAFKVSKRPRGFLGHVANLFAPMYETRMAVNGISFAIDQGEAVGLIGSNGAGKSTTMKMLSGILYPDSGSIEVAGFVPYRQRREYVANIGAVFGQKSQLSWDLPVIDSFDLLKHIYRVPEETYRANLAYFTELLGLASFIHQPVRQLSLGQRMRADITAALLHSPKLVFFDEPTIGLDVVVKERIREFVCRLNRERGVTILFTTHDMQDIERTCKRLIIIDNGVKLYDGTVDGILDKCPCLPLRTFSGRQACASTRVPGTKGKGTAWWVAARGDHADPSRRLASSIRSHTSRCASFRMSGRRVSKKRAQSALLGK